MQKSEEHLVRIPLPLSVSPSSAPVGNLDLLLIDFLATQQNCIGYQADAVMYSQSATSQNDFTFSAVLGCCNSLNFIPMKVYNTKTVKAHKLKQKVFFKLFEVTKTKLTSQNFASFEFKTTELSTNIYYVLTAHYTVSL